jgi:regulator of protease activity HflC (stomatin/prohibitin superfamily)
MLTVLVGLFIVATSWEWIVVTIPAGHVGVMWSRFNGGTVTSLAYGEGSHFVVPWNKMHVYDARVQQISREFDVLTHDGLTMTVNISVRFRLNDAMVGYLHQNVGPDYIDVLLIPAIGSRAGLVFSQNSTDDAYSLRRSLIQGEIQRAVMDDLMPAFSLRGVSSAPWLLVYDVLIRSVRFPGDLQAAINRKMEQYQLKEEYGYRLQREELESKRKKVEAEGIARFQRIVGAGISDNYLRWKGIDATLALAQSTNAKVVVIGTPKDGMPLILGGPDAVAPNAPGKPSTQAVQRSEVPLSNVPPALEATARATLTPNATPVPHLRRSSIFDRIRDFANTVPQKDAFSSDGVGEHEAIGP